MFSLPLYGISLLQMYIYFSKYPQDNKWLKLMVLMLGVIESVHEWMTCNTVYHYSILSYSHPETLIHGEWSVFTVEAIGTLICFLVEVFFVHMVYHITKGKGYRNFLLVIFIALITAQLGLGIYISVSAFLIWELSNLHILVYPGMVPMYVIRVVVDALAAAVLCIVLRGANQSSKFSSSMRIVRTLTIYAVNRFLLTTIVVLIQTIILLVRPESIWAMVMDFVTAHLYVNSLLATLNARNHLKSVGGHIPNYQSQQASNRNPLKTQNTVTSGSETSAEFQPTHAFGGHDTHMVSSTGKPEMNVMLDRMPDYGDDGIKVRTETFVMSDFNHKTVGNLV